MGGWDDFFSQVLQEDIFHEFIVLKISTNGLFMLILNDYLIHIFQPKPFTNK
jgi:hypothetical protein